MNKIKLQSGSEAAINITKRYTLGEEIFNSVSHGVGSLLSIAGTTVLIVLAAIHGGAWEVVSAAIYGASLIILYTMSTLYHALTNRRAKSFFRIMDHDTIFFLIAGTYTPITLIPLRGAVGWVLFGVIWGAAVLGIVMNSIDLEKFRKPSIVCYALMGWAVIFAIKPMLRECTPLSLWFLLIGGICYTGGIVFYIIKSKKYFHSIWHIFTVAGSVFHYFSVLLMIVNN
ncbi:MAG: hemolysin III family protein [Oscillospiraceae bacterium]|nr:hemolysin III family protein [Oscillospiraceae bacterium]